MSKGDWYRSVDKKKFDESFERIFGKRKLNQWNPEEDDNVREREESYGGIPEPSESLSPDGKKDSVPH